MGKKTLSVTLAVFVPPSWGGVEIWASLLGLVGMAVLLGIVMNVRGGEKEERRGKPSPALIAG